MFCSSCGAVVEDGTKFCGSCGAPVEDAPQPTPQPQPAYNPQPVAAPAPVAAPPQQPKKGGKTGLIIGLVVAIVVILAIIIGVVVAGNAKRCDVDGCKNPHIESGEYCVSHTCEYPSCTNLRADEHFCISHEGTCIASGCTNEATWGDYCIDHVCLYGSCTNPRESGSDYCSEHQNVNTTPVSTLCAAAGCTNEATWGNYCIEHVCLHGSCTNPRWSNGTVTADYCIDHVCLHGDCTNEREEGSNYCYLHMAG